MPFQLVTLIAGRYQSAGGQIVKITQVAVGRFFQRTEAVMFDVLMKVGMKATDDTALLFAGCAGSRPAHRAFGGDVHGLGVELL